MLLDDVLAEKKKTKLFIKFPAFFPLNYIGSSDLFPPL